MVHDLITLLKSKEVSEALRDACEEIRGETQIILEADYDQIPRTWTPQDALDAAVDNFGEDLATVLEEKVLAKLHPPLVVNIMDLMDVFESLMLIHVEKEVYYLDQALSDYRLLLGQQLIHWRKSESFPVCRIIMGRSNVLNGARTS